MKNLIEEVLAIEREQRRRRDNDLLSRYNSGKKVHKK